jgi:2-polyprenyl-3-methyl-5-hydroxy-6-metoxy-1,4-benzoquinol methylase
VNSCAHYYDAPNVNGLDINAVALKQAKAVGRLVPGGERALLHEANVFEFAPGQRFTVVNSLGVLHHTSDCHAAIRRVIQWIQPGGYLHLGLYHSFGRKPFLDHFREMRDRGASDGRLFEEFKRLNPQISDLTHLQSWFRDQVQHPHETQHTYEEIETLLREEGCVIEATSLNKFKRLPALSELQRLERNCERDSKRALYRDGRYYPGFFVVWARRTS